MPTPPLNLVRTAVLACLVACGSEAVPNALALGQNEAVVDASVTDAGSPGLQVIVVEQRLARFRPEFLEYFWNNLTPALFTRWSPAEHRSFAWVHAPRAPYALDSEVGASYVASIALAETTHQLTVSYVEHAAPSVGDPLTSEFRAQVMIDGEGPFAQTIQYRVDGEDTVVQQQLELPASEDASVWKAYLEARTAKLATFLGEVFQQDFVERELTSHGTFTIAAGLLETDVVVTQEIAKVSVDMVSWWWDNMGETERYRRWHPTAHKRFDWTTPPNNPRDLLYDVGAVQNITETIGVDTTLNIDWRNPAQAEVETSYDHYLYGGTNLDGTPFGGFLVHEYEALPTGAGVRMKSTFRIPTITSAATGTDFPTALGHHCIQEMQFLQYFLPALFAEQYRP